MPYYPYFFLSKKSFTCKNPEFFPSSLEILIDYYNFSKREAAKNTIFYFELKRSLCLASTIVTAILLLIYCEFSYF